MSLLFLSRDVTGRVSSLKRPSELPGGRLGSQAAVTFAPQTHGGGGNHGQPVVNYDHLYVPCPSLPGSSLMSPTDTSVHKPSSCDPLVVYFDPMFVSAANAVDSTALQQTLSTRLVHRGHLHDAAVGADGASADGSASGGKGVPPLQLSESSALDSAEIDGVVGVPGPSGGCLLLCVDDLHLATESSHALLRQVVESKSWHERVPQSGVMRFGVLGVQVGRGRPDFVLGVWLTTSPAASDVGIFVFSRPVHTFRSCVCSLSHVVWVTL